MGGLNLGLDKVDVVFPPVETSGFFRVTRGRSHTILYLSLRVVERAEVLPEFLETSDN